MDEDCQRVEFSPDLFVGRETELEELTQWASAETVSRRLKTIVAPPGYGKSWLLCWLEKHLRDSNRHGRDLFLIRVPTRVDRPDQAVAAWLPPVIKEAQKARPDDTIRDHNPADSPETNISHLLEDLCDHCSPPLRPLLIVDAFDDLLDNERRGVEKHLLEQFWGNSSVRIIMAFRDELGLKSPNLRRGEVRTPLQVFEPEIGQEQLQKLAAENPTPGLENLLPLIPPYQWTHPQINSYLYAIAQQEAPHRQPFAFTAEELRGCWISLIEERMTQYSMDPGIIENDLKTISDGEDTWTLETFARVCQYDQRNALDHLQSLMALSVVSHQAGGQRYQVVDGLRELLRAENYLRTGLYIKSSDNGGFSKEDSAQTVQKADPHSSDASQDEPEISAQPRGIEKIVQVNVHLETHIEKFTPVEQENFIHRLAQIIKISLDQIRILSAKPDNSVIVTLEMPEWAAYLLVLMSLVGEPILKALHITKVVLLHEGPKIGIITALPKEYVAVEALLENQTEYSSTGQGAGRRYKLGTVPAANNGQHLVVLSLAAGMGTNIAALQAASLLEHFPTITSIIMVGIAGGIPNPKNPDDHVRLGDVVVSDQEGVIQYDFDKEETNIIIHRHPPRPPSATLLQAVKLLEVIELKEERPWLKFIDKACNSLHITRPLAESDILVSSTNPSRKVRHPKDPKRVEGQPRIFTGPIASANKLLKNPLKRDYLRDKFKVKAVEMEGSGIADATWYHVVDYLVVRGICDYCDANKSDIWQAYAAVVAAAYTRSLLESIPC